METILRDLGHAARAARRAPGLVAATVAVLAGGIGAALPALGLVRGASLEPRPYTALAAAEGVGQSGWRTGWTELATPPSAAQDAGVRALLAVLLGLAVVLLAVAVLNAALLVLARGSARGHELRMRAVLGARPRRILAQLATEGGLLAAAACAGGLAAGAAGLAALRLSWPAGLPATLGAVVDARVVALALGLPLACVLAASLSAALPALRRGLSVGLGAAGRATAGRHEGAVREGLAVLSVAASVVLLAGAATLIRGSAAAGAAGSPPSARGALLVHLDLGASTEGVGERAASQASLLGRLRALPGVVDTSIATPGALAGLGTEDLVHALTGNPERPGVTERAHYHAVGPGFFRTLGLRPARGREFTAADTLGAEAVAVVNESFAARIFQSSDPVGRRIQLGRATLAGRWYTVVGVAPDVRTRGVGTPEEPVPALYLSALQHPPLSATLAVRTDGDASGPAGAVRAALRGGGWGEPRRVETLAAYREGLADPLRWLGRLFLVLAAVALAVSAAGLYGVVSYGVARRAREIGVRLALGARARDVVRPVLRDALRISRNGALLGLAGALCLGRLLQFLYAGIRPLDPVVYLAVASALAAVALLAAWRPASSAARVDPLACLGAE